MAACERGDLALASSCIERLHAHGLTPAGAEFVALVRLHAGLVERSGGGGSADAAAAEAKLDDLLRWVAEENPPLCDAQLAQLTLTLTLTVTLTLTLALTLTQVLAPLVLLNAALLRGLSLRAHAAELVPRFVEELVGELQRALDEVRVRVRLRLRVRVSLP